ncbi:hypothetical protein VULLAG_LOCUS8483 [Vulpes lagopus]
MAKTEDRCCILRHTRWASSRSPGSNPLRILKIFINSVSEDHFGWGADATCQNSLLSIPMYAPPPASRVQGSQGWREPAGLGVLDQVPEEMMVLCLQLPARMAHTGSTWARHPSAHQVVTPRRQQADHCLSRGWIQVHLRNRPESPRRKDKWGSGPVHSPQDTLNALDSTSQDGDTQPRDQHPQLTGEAGSGEVGTLRAGGPAGPGPRYSTKALSLGAEYKQRKEVKLRF